MFKSNIDDKKWSPYKILDMKMIVYSKITIKLITISHILNVKIYIILYYNKFCNHTWSIIRGAKWDYGATPKQTGQEGRLSSRTKADFMTGWGFDVRPYFWMPNRNRVK